MWHKKQRRRLGLETEHRRAMLRNIVIGLVEHGQIRTTYARAKEASRFADKLVTTAKKKSLHARRQVISRLNSRVAAKKLFDDIAPLFDEQNGGYTRVLKFDTRAGDGAQMAILEFTKLLVDPEEEARKEAAKAKEDKKSKKSAKAKAPEAKKESASKSEQANQESVEGQEEQGSSEEHKKGGFLGGLRKFLTGD